VTKDSIIVKINGQASFSAGPMYVGFLMLQITSATTNLCNVTSLSLSIKK
jgi:hypothetical protein